MRTLPKLDRRLVAPYQTRGSMPFEPSRTPRSALWP